MIQRTLSGLRRAPLLDGLPQTELDRLARTVREIVVRTGQELFHRGDAGRHVYWVLAGWLRVSGSTNGSRIVFEMSTVGDVLGEVAVLLGGRRTATAIAATDCVLASLHRRDVADLLQRRPEVASRMLALLALRLARTSLLVEDVVFRPLPQRLARCLVQLCRDHGESTPDGVRVAVPLTQSDLGELIGMSRESVNKQVGEWQAEGILTMRRGSLTVQRPDHLERLLA